MNVNRKVLTLDEFTIQQLRIFPNATGELSNLLRDMGLAAKRVNVEVNKAGLVDILGDAGTINVQGEDVKKLDIFANNQFMGVLRHGISCAGIGSEELDEFVVFDDEVSNNSKYVCLFDPLDGSGNIDVNVSIGTIFSVYRRVSERGKPCTKEDFLQPGRKQVAAGYIVYGSSTMMVYATRRGVNGVSLKLAPSLPSSSPRMAGALAARSPAASCRVACASARTARTMGLANRTPTTSEARMIPAANTSLSRVSCVRGASSDDEGIM